MRVDDGGKGLAPSLLVVVGLALTAALMSVPVGRGTSACSHAHAALTPSLKRWILASDGVATVGGAPHSCAPVGPDRAAVAARAVGRGARLAEPLVRFSNAPYVDRLAWIVIFERAAPFEPSPLGAFWAVFVDADSAKVLQAVGLPPRVP